MKHKDINVWVHPDYVLNNVGAYTEIEEVKGHLKAKLVFEEPKIEITESELIIMIKSWDGFAGLEHTFVERLFKEMKG